MIWTIPIWWGTTTKFWFLTLPTVDGFLSARELKQEEWDWAFSKSVKYLRKTRAGTKWLLIFSKHCGLPKLEFVSFYAHPCVLSPKEAEAFCGSAEVQCSAFHNQQTSCVVSHTDRDRNRQTNRHTRTHLFPAESELNDRVLAVSLPPPFLIGHFDSAGEASVSCCWVRLVWIHSQILQEWKLLSCSTDSIYAWGGLIRRNETDTDLQLLAKKDRQHFDTRETSFAGLISALELQTKCHCSEVHRIICQKFWRREAIEKFGQQTRLAVLAAAVRWVSSDETRTRSLSLMFNFMKFWVIVWGLEPSVAKFPSSARSPLWSTWCSQKLFVLGQSLQIKFEYKTHTWTKLEGVISVLLSINRGQCSCLITFDFDGPHQKPGCRPLLHVKKPGVVWHLCVIAGCQHVGPRILCLGDSIIFDII